MELEELPDSILLEIFRHLPYEELCLGVRMTCHRFRSISHDAALWKYIGIPHHFSDTRFLMLMRQVNKVVEGIECSQCENLTVAAFEGLGESEFPRLKHLAVPISGSYPDHVYVKLAQMCPLLENVENVRANEDDTCHPVICQSLFKCLKVVHDKPVSTHGRLRAFRAELENDKKRCSWQQNLETLAERCPDINSYHCRRGLSYVNDNTVSVIAELFPKISELELYYCDIGDDGLKKFFASHEGPLKSLVLDSSTGTTDAGIAVWSKYLGHLENLKIARCHNITNVGIKHLAESCPNLTQLHLNKAAKQEDFTDDIIKDFVQHCPKLTHVSIFKSSNITSKSVEAIHENCPYLHGLLLYECPRICDDGLRCLKTTRFLKSLVLMHCDVSPAGIVNLVLESPYLQRLVFFNKSEAFYKDMVPLADEVYSQIDEDGFQYKPNALKIIDVQGVGGAFMQLLTVLCPNLVSLSLREGVPITVKSLVQILQNSESLRILDISFLQTLDDSFVDGLCTHGTKVRKLALSETIGSLSKDALGKMFSDCASLKSVSFDLAKVHVTEEELVSMVKKHHGGHCVVHREPTWDGEQSTFVEFHFTPIKYLKSVPGIC